MDTPEEVSFVEGEVLNEDLNLLLPEGLTVKDLDRLVFWCGLFGVSFGRMDVDEKGPTKQVFLGQRRPKPAQRYIGSFRETQVGSLTHFSLLTFRKQFATYNHF